MKSKFIEKFETLSIKERSQVLALPEYLIRARDAKRLNFWLTDYDFLQTKIANTAGEIGLNQLIGYYKDAITENLDDKMIYSLLQSALQLSAIAVVRFPEQTYPQLYARLFAKAPQPLQDSLHAYQSSQPWLRLLSDTLVSVDSALIRVLVGHSETVLGCAVSDDGLTAVSASADHTLRVWNLSEERCTRILTGHRDQVSDCALSADGKIVLSASFDKSLRLWETQSGQCFGILNGHEGRVASCALSHDGKLAVSTSADATVRLWNVEQTKSQYVLNEHSGPVRCCALTGDGKILLTGSYDQTLRLWETETGICRLVLRNENPGSISSCAISADGRLALSTSNAILIEDEDITYAPKEEADDKLANISVSIFGGPDTGISLDHESLTEDDILNEDYDFVRAMVEALESSGLNLAEVLDEANLVRIWDLETGKCIGKLDGHNGRVNKCAITDDNRFAVSSANDSLLKIWDLTNKTCLANLRGTSSQIASCAINKSGNLALSGIYGGDLQVWNIKSSIERFDQPSLSSNVVTTGMGVGNCRFSSEGNLALAVVGETIQFWNPTTITQIKNSKTMSYMMTWDIALGVDNKKLLRVSGFTGRERRNISVVDAETGEVIQVLSRHQGAVNSVAVSQVGHIGLSASDDKTLCVWDITNGHCLRVLEGHTDVVDHCGLSQDGKLACSVSSDMTLRIWDTHTGKCLHILKGLTDKVSSYGFSGDGTSILTISEDYTAKFWNVSTGDCVHTFKLNEDTLLHICELNFDGRLALLVSPDNAIQVIQSLTGKSVATFTIDAMISATAFSPNNSTIMVGDILGNVHFLSLERFGSMV